MPSLPWLIAGAVAAVALGRRGQGRVQSGETLSLTVSAQAEATRLRERGDGASADAIERSLEVMRATPLQADGGLFGVIADATEQQGGEHYGGDEPFDYEHPIYCMQCRREGTAYIRDANYPIAPNQRSMPVEWLRIDPGWTVQMPASIDAAEGYRCPDHSFPRPNKNLGPPVPPRMRVAPGWYWYWVKPGDETIAWRVMLRRWGRPLYVMHSRKSWQDVILGSIELFEVAGQDIVWSMPSPLSRPKPAPNGAHTTLFDILAGGI